MNKIVLILSLLFVSVLLGQESSEYRLKAAFIERFTRFITWPADKQLKTPVVVGILGDGKIFLETKSFFEVVKIQNHPVEVRNVLPTSVLSDFDIILIGGGQKITIQELKKKLPLKPILTIGDSPTMASQGTMFAFNIAAGKLKFMINSGELEKSGLKVSSILLSSATVVTTDSESHK